MIVLGLPALLVSLAWLPDGPPLQDQLGREDPAALAHAVREQGDAAPGARVFYQKHLACTGCHGDVGIEKPPLGPDLAAMGPNVTDAHLIDAILDPSKEITKGFEPVTIARADGKTITRHARRGSSRPRRHPRSRRPGQAHHHS